MGSEYEGLFIECLSNADYKSVAGMLWLPTTRIPLHPDNPASIWTSDHFQKILHELESPAKRRLLGDAQPWSAHIETLRALKTNNLTQAQQEQTNLLQAITTNKSTPPIMHRTLLKAILLNIYGLAVATGRKEALEEASRAFSKCFTVLMTDRSGGGGGGGSKSLVLAVTSILFKAYFALGTTRLCLNILRVIDALQNSSAGAFPRIETFAKADSIPYAYYRGRLEMGAGKWRAALQWFHFALSSCHPKPEAAGQGQQIRLILIYFVIVKLFVDGQMVPPWVLETFVVGDGGCLGRLFEAIRGGNIQRFNSCLHENQQFLMSHQIYLPLSMQGTQLVQRRLVQRCTQIAMRLGMPEHRLPLIHLQRAFNMNGGVGGGGEGNENSLEDVECLVANLIAKDLIKGYISHERAILVLSKKNPFPAISQVGLSL